MNKIARPKLHVAVKNSNATEALPEKGGKKVAADTRIQKLNTILGPRGIRADEFLRKFDALTSQYEPDTILPVYLDVTIDAKGKSIDYTMEIKMPSTADIVKKKLKLEKLSQKPNLQQPIYKANKKFVEEIIQEKTQFYKNIKYDSFFKSIVGTLRSFGIQYEN